MLVFNKFYIFNTKMNYQTNINTNANCALFNNCWKKINVKEKFENPGFKAAHSAEIINNKMYVFGGWNGKKALSDLHIFDFNKLEWTEPEVSGSKPGLRNNHATCVYNEYMYLHGGHNGEIWQDDLYILDSNRLIWNKIDSNLTVRYDMFFNLNFLRYLLQELVIH